MYWLLPTLILTFGDAAALSPPPMPLPIVVAQTHVPGGNKSDSGPAAPTGTSDAKPEKEAASEGSSEGGQQTQDSQSPWTMFLVMGGIFLFFWLVFIRPQSKQQKEHQKLVSALKVGDPVITQGGVFGRIAGFDEANNALHLEVAKGVRIRILRHQVARLQGAPEAGGKDDKVAARK